MYKLLIKPIFFLFSPETIHHIIFAMVKFVARIPLKMWIWKKMFCLEDDRLKREVFGLTFDNPVGLAAGFDKDAKLYNELAAFGFGFIEIGTLTPKGQSGNQKPRLFRLPHDEALINRMGFNNGGVDEAVERLKKRNTDIIIGGNIGKNKLTPNQEATLDYEISFEALFSYVDYFVVNVSSPNTPNLRALQEKEPLERLLTLLVTENKSKYAAKPILLKIAPDLSNEQLDDIIEIVLETEIDGIIATNTTISRENLISSKETIENIGNGGLSGKPLEKKSTEVIRYISSKSGGQIPIIGVGGIHSAKDAIDKLDAGAVLLQLYTGFIYEGPSLIKDINREILRRRNDHK